MSVRCAFIAYVGGSGDGRVTALLRASPRGDGPCLPSTLVADVSCPSMHPLEWRFSRLGAES